jgi:hypothetical protein
MSAAVEAIRAELSSLRLQVTRLECAEALLASEELPTASHTTRRVTSSARPDTRASRARGHTKSDVHAPTSEQVRDYVLSHGPVSRRQLLEALGGNPHTMDNRLKWLISSGAIVREGERGKRQYLAPEGLSCTGRSVTISASRDTSFVEPPQRGVYPVYDAIVDLGDATTDELATHLEQPSRIVVEGGRRLVKLGLVRFTSVGDVRKWLPAAPPRNCSIA